MSQKCERFLEIESIQREFVVLRKKVTIIVSIFTEVKRRLKTPRQIVSF